MYEEEDHDLTAQHLRLTAHLQTRNADFDRRLAAHLANHVTIRSGLGQAVLGCWQNNQFDINAQVRKQDMIQPTPHIMHRAPVSHNHTTYSIPNAQGQQLGQREHWTSSEVQRDLSIREQDVHSIVDGSVGITRSKDRLRPLLASDNPQDWRSESGKLAIIDGSPGRGVLRCSSATNLTSQHSNFQQSALGFRNQPKTSCQSPQLDGSIWIASNQTLTGPLSTTFSTEIQQLLDSSSREFSCNSVTPSFILPQNSNPVYSYNPNGRSNSIVDSTTHHSDVLLVSQIGIGQTLALPMLDKNSSLSCPPVSAEYSSAPAPAMHAYGGKLLDNKSACNPYKEPTGAECVSGTATPSEIDRQLFLSVTD
jgi:hypothetical protein